MQITYILGAGASANALPVIKENSNKGILGLTSQIKHFVEQQTSTFLTRNADWDSRNIQVLKEIVEKCTEFGTPDLYAKFLLETGDDDNYHLLKSLLSIFFKHKQEIEQCFDYRALSFLTTISENKKIPKNIKIISWNYDSQIEMAAARLKKFRSNTSKRIDGFSCWPNTRDGDERNSGQPFLLHLNGVAGTVYSQRDFYEVIGQHHNFDSYQNKEHLLSFAWEDETRSEKRIFTEQRLTVACEIAKGTEILVVIGYSFPFFNRKLDKEIIKAMKGSLRKIYFQDPFADGSQLRTQFELTSDASINIEHVKYIDNYHIPFEL